MKLYFYSGANWLPVGDFRVKGFITWTDDVRQLYRAEVLEKRINPNNNREEYYVHYEGLDRRLDEWIAGNETHTYEPKDIIWTIFNSGFRWKTWTGNNGIRILVEKWSKGRSNGNEKSKAQVWRNKSCPTVYFWDGSSNSCLGKRTWSYHKGTFSTVLVTIDFMFCILGKIYRLYPTWSTWSRLLVLFTLSRWIWKRTKIVHLLILLTLHEIPKYIQIPQK